MLIWGPQAISLSFKHTLSLTHSLSLLFSSLLSFTHTLNLSLSNKLVKHSQWSNIKMKLFNLDKFMDGFSGKVKQTFVISQS